MVIKNQNTPISQMFFLGDWGIFVKMSEGHKISCHLALSTVSFFIFPVKCNTLNLISNTQGMA